MRTMNWTIGMTGVLAVAFLPYVGGCFFTALVDCEHDLVCSGAGGGGMSSSSTTSTSTSTGGTGGTPINCIPSADLKTELDASCGVFVSATGDDGATGTQEKPVQSLKQAMTLALGGKKRIYACAEEFAGAVELPAGLTVYGGLDCSKTPRSWLYVGDKTKTTITADAEEVPLTLASGKGTKLFDLHVLAKAAVNAGGSSIALVADHASAEISGCLFEAGDGQAGAQGKPYASAAAAGATGVQGGDACSMNTVAGGDPVSSLCGTPDSSSGLGGSGTSVSGGNGSSGLPDGSMNFGAGEGGSACTTGKKGNDGIPGIPGPGATGLGAIAKDGFSGVIGTPGVLGPPGQGGGGGGGAKGGIGVGKCLAAGMAGGAAGGSGGSGGCGGAGGKGGNPGGSSIALLSLGSTLTFAAVMLTTGKGGNGGDGGPGQDGGNGGTQGAGGTVVGMNGLNPGCAGGPGGLGGTGGTGGGGIGGHSIAIAFTGAEPPKSGWMATTGPFGAGGLGGNAASAGAPGVKANTQVFQ